jgi:hypothetical protein
MLVLAANNISLPDRQLLKKPLSQINHGLEEPGMHPEIALPLPLVAFDQKLP